jgi:hypothetical protein
LVNVARNAVHLAGRELKGKAENASSVVSAPLVRRENVLQEEIDRLRLARGRCAHPAHKENDPPVKRESGQHDQGELKLLLRKFQP